MCKNVITQWNSNLWDDSDRGSGGWNKLRTYRKFKQNFELESYLFLIKDPLVRKSLCCFRISCHPLQIKRGRYQPTPIPANQRHCPLCLQRKMEVVEDEAHFMIKCESYVEERRLLLDIAVAPNLPPLM